MINKTITYLSLVLLFVSVSINIYQKNINKKLKEENNACNVKYSCLFQDVKIIKQILLGNRINYSFVHNTMPNWCLLGSEPGILSIYFNYMEFVFRENDQLLIDIKINIDSSDIQPCYRLIIPPQGMEIEF